MLVICLPVHLDRVTHLAMVRRYRSPKRSTDGQPNVLLIMTDEERYPPPYETDAVDGVPAHPAHQP